ncbi:MAG: Sensor histidine kinase WalK [Paracidovorax wautersii]|uniref:histidine kinase n=1 Tax=Paracidovorax wautersii TaxID=1177982 RepID=A0A7V8FN42_9BURK|nr:MAG: Sensor histidine kinase WalK [Paracidovorax wautersii]
MPAISALAFATGHVLFAPAAGMVGIALAYALWSWQRLNVATRYLVDEFQALRNSTGIGRWAGAQPARRGDFLARRIDALDQAAQHLRDLYQLFSDSLDSLPDATLACDLAGHVLLANPPAARLLGQSAQALTGQSLAMLLADLRRSDDGQPALPAGRLTQTHETVAIEAIDAHGRDRLLKLAPSRNAREQHTGWLVSLVDISEVRRAQRQRAEAIRFLGHDIRAPQSSILSLLELRRSAPGRIPIDQFETRVERHALKTLKLSDDFIQLLRAQTGDHRLAPHNLAGIVDECLDDAWETASQRQITLWLSPASRPDAMVRADRELLARAIGNLIGNALKFSPPGTRVTCGIDPAVHDGRAAWQVAVTDQGPGVLPQDQDRLFTPFTRGSQSTQPDGAGLGLAFVKAVADSHGGWVALQSTPGQGASFSIALPAIGEGDAAAAQS